MTETARQKQGRKYHHVLDGARDVFLRDGFDGAKVDDIAKAAGVSKATLYSYFPDKRSLFTKMIAEQLHRMEQDVTRGINFDNPPTEVLGNVTREFLGLLSSDIGVKMFRITVAETERFPELGEAFYESGPAVMHTRLQDYFHLAQSRGELTCDDFSLAAYQFAELSKAEIWLKLLLRPASKPTQDEINRIADGAVATFMAKYGPKEPTGPRPVQ